MSNTTDIAHDADRTRWFARYGDDYATPADAEADYCEYVKARWLARAIMDEAFPDETPRP